jgi:hypothetical protein
MATKQAAETFTRAELEQQVSFSIAAPWGMKRAMTAAARARGLSLSALVREVWSEWEERHAAQS